MIEDWEAAYDNRAAEADAEAIFADWAARSAAFRAQTHEATLDMRYDAHPRCVLDLFRPAGAAQGLVVVLHGGYWRALSKEAFSWTAAGPLARGWAAAVPSYPLAPQARIADIGRAAAAATVAAAQAVAGPIVLAGHSAGGQLAARLMCADGLLPQAVAARVRRVVGISGLYDLRPLLRLSLNETLGLDAAEAAAESPVLAAPRPGLRLLAWVGGAERPEFRRQNALLANIWTGLGAACTAVEAPGHRHFSVLEPLAAPHSDLVAQALA